MNTMCDFGLKELFSEALTFEDDLKDFEQCEKHVFVDENHKTFVLQRLTELRTEGLFCDMSLLVDNKCFPVHKNVLASCSPYFKAMFTLSLTESNKDVVRLNDIDAATMGLLLDYAYTGIIKMNSNNVQSLLSAANLLQFINVKEIASIFLGKHLHSSNCLGIHYFAECHSCFSLTALTKNFVLQNFQDVSKEDEFLSLCPNKLIEFIKCDKLIVESEEAVFKAVMRWFSHDSESRKVNFYKILENVRLPLMNPYFLCDFVENTPVIRNCSECMKLIEEAKKFHLLPDRRLELQSERTKPRDSAAEVQVIVAVGGEEARVAHSSVECYDPRKQIWQPLSGLPFKISQHGLVVSGKNTLYLVGGKYSNGRVSKLVYRYDSILNSWQMAPLLFGRSELGLAMLDGFVYAVGGWDGAHILDSVEKFDVNDNSWQTVAPMKMAITSPACVAHNGMIYVTGGKVFEKEDGIDLVQRYDPVTDTWVKLAPMLIPRTGSAACFYNDYIYVLGGWHAIGKTTNKVERYNIENDKWEFVPSMCKRRYRPGVAVVDGKIFVLGGEERKNCYHNSIEYYDSYKNQWTFCGKMTFSKSWLGCAPLQIKRSLLSNKSNS